MYKICTWYETNHIIGIIVIYANSECDVYET
jgi:hypothetical protein